MVVSATAEGVPMVGLRHRLYCVILLPDGITSPLVVEWYGSEGRLSSGNEVTIRDIPVSDTNITSVLEFNPFRTAHGGRFSCRATIISQAPPFNISKTAEIDIIVGGNYS